MNRVIGASFCSNAHFHGFSNKWDPGQRISLAALILQEQTCTMGFKLLLICVGTKLRKQIRDPNTINLRIALASMIFSQIWVEGLFLDSCPMLGFKLQGPGMKTQAPMASKMRKACNCQSCPNVQVGQILDTSEFWPHLSVGFASPYTL